MDWSQSTLLHRREISRTILECLGRSGILPQGDSANEWDGWRRSRNMKITLLANSNTDTARVRELLDGRWESANIEILEYTDLTKASKLEFLKHLRNISSDVFVLGLYDIRVQQRVRLYKAIALVPKTGERLLIDQNGRVQCLSRTRFLLLDAPLIIVELLLAPFVLAKCWLKVRYGISRVRETGKCLEKKSDRLKLAYLRTNFWFNLKAGGSVGHTVGVISGLTESGVGVFSISTDELFGVDKGIVPIYIVYAPRLFNTFAGLSRLAYNRKLAKNSLKIVEKEKPDLIYQRYSMYNYSGVTLASHLNIPFVLEFNSSEVWKIEHWSNKKNRLLRLVKDIKMLNLMAADLVVVVSEPLKRDLVAWGIDGKKILVNPNGIDPQKFDPEIAKDQRAKKLKQELGLKNDEVIVGFTGTFGVWHGIPQLTEAIDDIMNKQPFSNVHFLLVGDGQLRSDMEKQVGHYEKVTFTGQVPYSDIQYYLAICDIFVSPHNPQIDGKEFFGSPTKLYEYMAMRKGIVASNLGQIGQVLEDGKTALLVEPGDVEALVDGILRLLRDKELRENLGWNARRKAIAEHTWKQNVEKVIEALSVL